MKNIITIFTAILLLFVMSACDFTIIADSKAEETNESSDFDQNSVSIDLDREISNGTENETENLFPKEDQSFIEKINIAQTENESVKGVDSFKNCNTHIFSYFGDLRDSVMEEKTAWHIAHKFNNTTLTFYHNDSVDNYLYLGVYAGSYSIDYGYDAIGLELKDFIDDMGETISEKELSELLGIRMVIYEGASAEDSYINRVNETPYCCNNKEYQVYLYSPLDNPNNDATTISKDSFIAFLPNSYYGMKPLKCAVRDSWIDNSKIIFNAWNCPFVGMSFDSPGMEIYYGDDDVNISYTDPQSGWCYHISDPVIDGSCISEYAYTFLLSMPAADLLPDMPEALSFEEFCIQYVNLPGIPQADWIEEYWDAYPDAYFLVYGVNPIKVFEWSCIGVDLSFDVDENGCITKDSTVNIRRTDMNWD